MEKSKMTIRDVAKEAGVSIATVSRYINQNGYVSQQSELKIKRAMEKFEYAPNEIARGLAKKKTNTLALIIPDITNPFFPELITAIERIAKSKGYSLILVNAHEEEIDSFFWRNFQNRYVDGFILASFQFNEGVLKSLRDSGIPFVRIDRAVDKDAENSVGINNYKGAQMAVEHLIEVGCKQIAHVSGPKTFYPSLERIKGFTNIIKSTFPEATVICKEGDFTLESGRQITLDIMSEYPNVDGLFVANDLMAIGAIKALYSLNLSVPEDVAVIGFDGIKLTEMMEPEISTIAQPIYEIGVVATNKIIEMIEKSTSSRNCSRLEVSLIKRKSTLR